MEHKNQERTESMKEYASDATITAEIKAKIYTDALIKLFQITVETYKGIVLLSGFVDTQQQADRSEEIAQSVDGVKEVRTNFIIKEDL